MILVTGIPGAFTHVVMAELLRLKCQLHWHNQDSSLSGYEYSSRNNENHEFTRIHDTILDSVGQGWFTENGPRFYDVPYPGPAEFRGMFYPDTVVAQADFRLCLFLPIWTMLYKRVYVCGFSVADSAGALHRWCNGHQDRSVCERVAQHYQHRMQEHIAGDSRCVALSEQDIRSGAFKAQIQI